MNQISKQSSRYLRDIDDIYHRAGAAAEQLVHHETLPENPEKLLDQAAQLETAAEALISAGQRALVVAGKMKGYAEAFGQLDRGEVSP